MAAALLLGLATVATLAVVSSGQALNVTLCPPCNKMMEKVCAKDKDGKAKTFANPCLIDFCNCMLNLSKIRRVFSQAYDGDCQETETEIPQCFAVGSSTSSTSAAVNLTTTTEATSATTAGGRSTDTTTTSAATAGGRSANTTTTSAATNTTTEAPGGGAPGLKTMLFTLALPLAAIPIFL